MRVFVGTAAAAFVVGIASSFAVGHFVSGRIAVVGSFIGLQRSYNEGIAFGMNLPFQTFFILGALIVVTIMGVHASESRIRSVAFGLIVGGGWANIVDRMIDGKVTDVFQVGSFPIFNVADSCISVGVALLLGEMLLPAIGRWRKRLKSLR